MDLKTESFVFLATLGLVVGVSIFQLNLGQIKTRDAQRKADVELVARALNKLLDDHKVLPAANAQGQIIACGSRGLEACVWGEGPIVDFNNVSYLSKIPVEPFAYKNWTYNYEVNADRTKYKVYIALENRNDEGLRKNLSVSCGPGVQCNWYAYN